MAKSINWPFVLRSYFFWVFMPMASLFVFGYTLDLVLPENPESREKTDWCEEYHPNKSWNEFAKIAGW